MGSGLVWVLVVLALCLAAGSVWAGARRAHRHAREHPSAHALAALSHPSLSSLSPGRFLEEVLGRAREATGAGLVALVLEAPAGGDLEVAMADGERVWLAAGPGDGAPGSVLPENLAACRESGIEQLPESVVGIGSGHEETTPAPRSMARVPVTIAGQLRGAVVAVSAEPDHFAPKDVRLLEVVADRCSGSIEQRRLVEAERRNRLAAEHARLHLGMLSRAGLVLTSATDSYEQSLALLADVVVPDFADWFCVDLVDDTGLLSRVATCARDSAVAVASDGPLPHPYPAGDRLVHQAITSGQPSVVMPQRSGPRHGGEPGGWQRDAHGRPDAGVESMLVVPIRVRGLSIGALTFVTEPGRRGYRRSDLDTAEELADRVGVTVERVMSWRESQAAEAAAIRHAARLQALMEAALVVNAPLAQPQVLDVLVSHAHRVVEADHVAVAARDGDELVVELDRTGAGGWWSAEDVRAVVTEAVDRVGSSEHRRGASGDVGVVVPASETDGGPELASWIAVPLNDGDTGRRRVLVAIGAPGESFSIEDESVLGLLAQMAAVALKNAHLYDVVRGSEHRLRAILDASPLPIAEVGLEGTARWWNRAAADLFGWRQSQENRIPVRPAAADLLQRLWDRSSLGEATVGTELGAGSPAGGQLELSVSAAPLRDAGGAVDSVLVVAEDITERRRLLDQFHQAERLSAMARMAGGLAHDFNNLLTVILGCSEVLMRRVGDDEPLAQEVAAIQRAGHRAAALTGQLLAIGRRRSDQLSLTDLDEVVCAMEPMLVGLLGEDVELELVPDAASRRILVDQAELERAVLNLAINARDAMPEGGHLSVRSRVERARPPADPGMVALSVSDTGVGMEVEIREHCFEPFFTTKGLARGTGLGLSMVHAMVTQAGGHIDVESAPGRGTTFTMWFPVADEELPATAPIEAGSPDAFDRVLLFVEDEPELRRLSVRELEGRGFTVVDASSATEALDLLASLGGVVDLVVTDVIMPGMSGLELRRCVADRYPGLPVLLISGHLEGASGGEGLDPETSLLGKPFTPDQLVARVRELLAGRLPGVRRERE